jgi:hypothetical protein
MTTRRPALALLFAALLFALPLAAQDPGSMASKITRPSVCGDAQVLKFNASTGLFECQDEGAGGGQGDNISVNAIAAADANFIDSATIGFSLNATPTPDEISARLVTSPSPVRSLPPAPSPAGLQPQAGLASTPRPCSIATTPPPPRCATPPMATPAAKPSAATPPPPFSPPGCSSPPSAAPAPPPPLMISFSFPIPPRPPAGERSPPAPAAPPTSSSTMPPPTPFPAPPTRTPAGPLPGRTSSTAPTPPRPTLPTTLPRHSPSTTMPPMGLASCSAWTSRTQAPTT